MSAVPQVSARGITIADAKVAKALLDNIQKRLGHVDTLTVAADFVEKSRPKSSPTHHMFEWDDRKAAAKQRIAHAHQIIIAIRVTFVERPDAPVRAFPILVSNGVRGPIPIQKVMASPDLTKSMLDQALKELATFKRKYEGLADLKDVFASIEKVLASKRQ